MTLLLYGLFIMEPPNNANYVILLLL